METEAVTESTAVVGSVQQNSQQALTSSTLPDELWERIMTYLPASQMQKASRLSRRHLALTKSTSFQARYFLACHMPCQALFYASKRSQLFTPQLIEVVGAQVYHTDLCADQLHGPFVVLKSLVSQGAVMSRYFAHSLLHQAIPYCTYHYTSPWKGSVSSNIVLAVLCKAQELYGDNFDVFSRTSDGDAILDDGYDYDGFKVDYYVMEKIFVDGRFAPFCPLKEWNLVDSRFLTQLVMNPDLIEQMSQNGYIYSREERDSM